MNRLQTSLINIAAGGAVAFGFHEAYQPAIDALADTGTHGTVVAYDHILGDFLAFVGGYGAADWIQESRRRRAEEHHSAAEYAAAVIRFDEVMSPLEAEHYIIRH